jgi:hypothetical protein
MNNPPGKPRFIIHKITIELGSGIVQIEAEGDIRCTHKGTELESQRMNFSVGVGNINVLQQNTFRRALATMPDNVISPALTLVQSMGDFLAKQYEEDLHNWGEKIQDLTGKGNEDGTGGETTANSADNQ